MMQTHDERIQLIESLYKQYYSYLFHYLATLTMDRQLIEDIIQDVFATLIRKTELVIDLHHVKQYLVKSTRNKLIDCYRKTKRSICTQDEQIAEAAGSSDFENSLALNDAITTVLAELPEHYRFVILAKDYYGYSFQEIAKATGGTSNSVKTRICRARKQFKSCYQ